MYPLPLFDFTCYIYTFSSPPPHTYFLPCPSSHYHPLHYHPLHFAYFYTLPSLPITKVYPSLPILSIPFPHLFVTPVSFPSRHPITKAHPITSIHDFASSYTLPSPPSLSSARHPHYRSLPVTSSLTRVPSSCHCLARPNLLFIFFFLLVAPEMDSILRM